MKSMSKPPDNPVSQFHAKFFEDAIVHDIERVYFSVINKISDLPANTPRLVQNAETSSLSPLPRGEGETVNGMRRNQNATCPRKRPRF
jgi:hypothetical protein